MPKLDRKVDREEKSLFFMQDKAVPNGYKCVIYYLMSAFTNRKQISHKADITQPTKAPEHIRLFPVLIY